MKQQVVTSCPYCGKRMDYWFVMLIKERNEYICSKCNKVYNIELSKSIKRLSFLFQIIALAITIVSCLTTNIPFFIPLGLLILMFGGFYLQVPFEIYLKKRHKVIRKTKPLTTLEQNMTNVENKRQLINSLEPINNTQDNFGFNRDLFDINFKKNNNK